LASEDLGESADYRHGQAPAAAMEVLRTKVLRVMEQQAHG
jgi:hypothetical protein